jgi:hypothetical protein
MRTVDSVASQRREDILDLRSKWALSFIRD